MTKKQYAVIGTVLAVGLVTAMFYFVATPGGGNYMASLYQNTPQNVSADTSPSPGIPITVIIPSINVKAPILQAGLDDSGAVVAPEKAYDTTWFKLGARPGQQGSAVITGHYGTWRDGSHSVFDNLNKLKLGDKVQITDDKNATLTFIVKKIKLYEPGQIVPEIFNKSDGAYLNLITCQGAWLAGQRTYNQRLVVFTELVK